VSGEPGGDRGRFASLFTAAENGTPLAAELPKVAELLGRPLAEVKRAARRVEPYIAADGSPRWSVRLVAVELAAAPRRREPAGSR
jgi:Ser/Thr protein kinase RdoA (MazF antagonist)